MFQRALGDDDDDNKAGNLENGAVDSDNNYSPRRRSSEGHGLLQRACKHVSKDVEIRHADLMLLLCCFVSGLCDSSTYNAWSTFVSMQTGNTIFVALGASNQPASKPYGWLRSLVSIACFLLGSFLFSLTRHVGNRRRISLSLSFLLQAICILLSAALVQTGVVSSDVTDIPRRELIPIALLGFQAGGQVNASDIFGFREIPTTVLTSVYFGIASDPHLFTVHGNPKRNRRCAAVVLMLVGGLIGGWMARTNAGMEGALWLAGGLKAIAGIGWLIWSSKRTESESA